MVWSQSSALVFFVNGKKVVDDQVNPEWTLLTYLRNKLRLCGTKLGCGEGGCGACTVMVSRYDRKSKNVIHIAVNACLTPVCAMHGAAVTTVEGIGSVEKGLHPVQERIARSHGSQCGFCTPGIVMSMYTLLRNTTVPKFTDMETAFQGNLCRCTGYRPILEGFKTFLTEGDSNDVVNGVSNGCCGKKVNGGCCMSNGTTEDDEAMNQNGNGNISDNEQLFSPETFKPYDPTQEPIFPPELLLSSHYDDSNIVFHGERVTWYRPVKLDDLLELKASYPYAKIVVGNTEIGVEVKFKNMHYPVIIQPSRVEELTAIRVEDNGVHFGASVTLNDLDQTLQQQIQSQPKHKTRIFSAIVEMLRWFAGKQIRNAAAIGGNIITGSPISDLNPIFMAAHCLLELRSKDDHRFVTMDDSFFTGYRKNILKSEEILVSILIPFTKEDEYFWGFKQAKRRDDDIAITNAGMRVQFEVGTTIIKDISLAFGGMAPTTVMARTAAASLIGQQWNEHLVREACQALIEDLPLSPGAPGGMIQFRRSLTLSFFFKFYLVVTSELSKKLPYIKPLDKSLQKVVQLYHRDSTKSCQLSQVVPDGQPDYDLVGRPVAHLSALKQATGEAVYIDDIPRYEGELYLTLVLSTKAHAHILSIDATEALKVEGVVEFFSAKDIEPKRNHFGAIIHDEEVFATSKVTCIGQIIGAIVAVDQATSQRASKLVKVDYEEIHPVIVTIEDAIKNNSFYDDWVRQIKDGDVEDGFNKSDGILEGELHLGGQEHFYLETHASVAIPREDDEIELLCSTQHPAEVQHLTSHVLGIPSNRITCRTRRMGGGFGGKESRAVIVAVPVALAAKKLKRPIRCMLDRDEDMAISGTRHPFFCKYKVGFTKEGRIISLKLDIFNNAGNTLDLSCSILERSLFSADNGYKIPNVEFNGKCCRTNLPSNTAFRGFGGPQGMMFCEMIFDVVAEHLKMDQIKIRDLNMLNEGDLTHYGQKLDYCTVRRCWSEVLTSSHYAERRQKVDEFNRQNRWRKRGIATIPTKFGIAFTALFLNQADRVPNASATAASAGSDLNGMAVLNACKTIMERLKPFKLANPKGKWEDWVNAAYFDRVSLSATGFYKTPEIGFNIATKTGKPFNYFCFGAACAEVEIDCLTGDHEVLRTDIVMDVGESINPAIDIGQVEGGFMQGYGLYTLEQLMYSPQGFLFTKGPGQYKLPGFGDIPAEFNVALLRGAPNPKAVFSSKAVGEPPLFLAASVFFAIKDAIKSARSEVGLSTEFRLDSPATAERIRMGCEDEFTEKFPTPPGGSFKPWAVIV
ncbi:unnamed protein product [Allacma fusca]|uniref:xanthine dehydrogenase n=1 Tax=Allacma fusca TaxID=39272 RepID=A0A8J2LKH3_9HEXA|nr:unnamed protein product [Allacma fusca]